MCALGITAATTPSFDRDGDAHIYVIVKANPFGAPACIQSRMLQQNACHQRDQQIGMSDADLVRALDFGQRCVRDIR